MKLLSALLRLQQGGSSAIVRSMVGSLGSALAGQLSLLVSGIIAARLLGPEDRGHLALLALIPTVISQIGLLGVQSSVTYQVARDKALVRPIFRLLRLPLLLQITLGTAIQAIVVFGLLSLNSPKDETAALFTLLVTPAMFLQQYCLAALQGLQRFRYLNACRFLPSGLYAAGTLGLVAVGERQLPVFAITWTVTNMVAAAATVFALFQVLPGRPDTEQEIPNRRELFGFGIRGFLGSASPIETFRIDQAVVGGYLSPTALGIYVSSLAFTNFPRFMAQSIGLVAYPYVASQSQDDRVARKSMWRFFWLTVALSVFVTVFLILMAGRLVPLVFGNDFREAIHVTQILLVGSAFFSARRILGEGLRGRGHPSANTIAEGASWVSMLVLLPFLAPRWGLDGVAIGLLCASVLSFLCLVAIAYRIDRRNNELPRTRSPRVSTRLPFCDSLRPLIVVVGAFFIAAICGQIVTTQSVRSSVVVLGLFGAAPLVIAVFRRIEPLTAPVSLPHLSSVREEEEPNEWSSALVFPRMLYFGGAATVTILAIRPTSFMTVSDWFFLASLFLTAVLITMNRIPISGRLPGALLVGVALYSLGGFFSSLETPHVLASILVLIRFVYLTVVWFWLGSFLLDRIRYVQTAIVCWSIAAALTGAASVAQLLLGDVIPGTTPVWGRMTGLAQHINDLGGATAVALVPTLTLVSEVSNFRRKAVISIAIVPLVFAGLILSGSVGAWIGVAAGLAIWIIANRISPRIIVFGALIALSSLVILDVQQQAGAPSPLDRLRGTTDASSQYCTVCSRLQTNDAAWSAISESPFIGVGLDPISGTTSTGSEVHNMILGTWYEAGFLGAVGMLVILGAVFWSAIAALRHSASLREWRINLSLACSFVSFFVIGMTQPILFQRYGWFCAALIVACRQIQKTRESRVPIDVSHDRRRVAARIELVVPASRSPLRQRLGEM